ncbi:MAG: hypothetical protein U0R80_13230 [Nocardioidaceae bacterium]
MTLLRDQLNVLADSTPVPPAPTLLDLERRVRQGRRVQQRWVVAAAAAAALVVGGSVVWLGRGDDGKPEPAGPPTWSDVDVPWTADGKLHWRDAVVDVEPLTAYAQGKDVLWLLKDGFVTEVFPDGYTIDVLSGVQGPLAADPDSRAVVWSDGKKLNLFRAIDENGSAETVPSGPLPNALVMSLSDNVARGVAERNGSEDYFAADMSGSFVVPEHRAARAVDDRGGWLVVTYGRLGRLRAVSDEAGSVDLGRGAVVGIGPGAAYVAVQGQHGRVQMTELPSGVRTPVGLPAGSSPVDMGYRWTSAGDLVMPMTTERTTEDPMVSWYLCSAPDWSCEAMDVPQQRRSDIPLAANFWNFAMAVGTETRGGASSASAVSSPEAQ